MKLKRSYGVQGAVIYVPKYTRYTKYPLLRCLLERRAAIPESAVYGVQVVLMRLITGMRI